VLTIYQRLVLGYVLLLALLVGLGLRSAGLLNRMADLERAHQGELFARQPESMASRDRSERARSRLAAEEKTLVASSIAVGILLSAGFLVLVIRPLHRTAIAARRIAGGELQQSTDWRMHDDLGAITVEINHLAAQLRDLRDTESGRRQLDHQLSSAVVESIFEPVIVTDAQGRVLRLNQAAVRTLGAVGPEGAALAEVPGGERILDAVREAVEMQRPTAGEGESALLPMKIGQAQRSYRLRTTPMRDEDGRLLGTVTVLEDITEMQDLDRFKTRFLAIASRKLREPLERLRLSLYTLSRGYAGELRALQSDLIHGAEEESERLNDLMSDLIEVSELDTGRREIRIDRLRPIDILRDACGRHREEARKKHIEIEIRSFEDLLPVSADRQALRSIMDNLVSNAIRYSPEGGSIVLEARDHRDKVQFFVRDSGRGIEPERLPGIFGRFNTPHDGGTGLGLALVRRLVETLGGQVSVESRIGHGSTFSFTLPVAPVSGTRHPIEVG
jgi:signal transduction histidine kinase/HAMP domain-containing protein